MKFQRKLFVLLLGLYSLPALAAINQGSGNFTHSADDYLSFAETALGLSRNYNSKNTTSGPLGQGWTMSYLTERLVVTQPETVITGNYSGLAVRDVAKVKRSEVAADVPGRSG